MPTQKNLHSIQGLRGIAASLVVFCHATQYIDNFLPVSMERIVGTHFGMFGVDIFFVISGFIMVYICTNNFGNHRAVIPFITRRALRIFPVYWLVLLITLTIIIPSGWYACAMLAKQQNVIQATHHSSYILKNFLLIPGNINPIVAVSWTLFFEMFFYYVFGALLFFNRNIYLPVLCTLFPCLVIAKLAHFHAAYPFSAFVDYYGNDMILEFIFGCFIAEQYIAGKLLQTNVAILILFGCLLAIALSYHGNFMPELTAIQIESLKYGLPSAGIVLSVLSLEINGALSMPKFLIALGESSYSIYLTHLSIFLVLLIVGLKWLTQFIFISGNQAALAAWILCLLFGHVFYLYIEKPIARWLRERMPNTIPFTNIPVFSLKAARDAVS